jgi:hypothetical protein
MLRRLNQLRSLARGRADHDEPFGDLPKWAMLFADCMLFHTKGCDYFTFRDALRSVPTLSKALDEKTIMGAIHAVTRIAERRGAAYRTIRASTAGKWLDLRAEECWLYGISTLRAVDETPADRKAWCRQNDRERKCETRRKADKAQERERARQRRAAKGAKPHAESFSRTRPWRLKGVSRATFYRHRETDSSVLPILSRNTRTDEFVSPAAAAPQTNGHCRQRQGQQTNGHRLPSEGRRTAEHESAAPLGTFNAVDVVWIPMSSEARQPPLLFDASCLVWTSVLELEARHH